MEEMNDDFFDWLNECPVNWILDKTDDGNRSYTFIKPSEEKED